MMVCNLAKALTVLALLALGSACASVGKPTPKSVVVRKPLLLTLKNTSSAQAGADQHEYYTRTLIRTIEDNQLRDEKDEIAEFKVNLVSGKVSEGQQDVRQTVTVQEKNGFIDLHDLGFPEIGETLELRLAQNGQVLQAGSYPKNSNFFIPPIVLPDYTVEIGDTWVYSFSWYSTKSSLPMRLELLSILKGVYVCETDDQCMDIEIQGQVYLERDDAQSMAFESRHKGRLIYNNTKGRILWSSTLAKEGVFTPNGMIHVLSCVGSKLTQPVASVWEWNNNIQCSPLAEDATLPF